MADEDEIPNAAPEAEVAEAEQAETADAPQAQDVEDTGAPEPEASAEEAPASSEPAPARPEPTPVLAPKERRRRARAAKAPSTRPERSPADRQAERDAERAKKAHARRHGRGRARAEKPASSGAAPASAPVEHAVGRPKTRQGVVVSDKADKTITVRVDTARRHRRYEKVVRRHTTFHAHDEHNEAHEGDLVRIVESRPLSATKRWRLVEVVERAK